MAYEPKPGDFLLFKNDKGDNPKRPDYRGEGTDLNGSPVEIACWLKEGKKGKFMACSMKPHGKKAEKKDDGIPF